MSSIDHVSLVFISVFDLGSSYVTFNLECIIHVPSVFCRWSNLRESGDYACVTVPGRIYAFCMCIGVTGCASERDKSKPVMIVIRHLAG